MTPDQPIDPYQPNPSDDQLQKELDEALGDRSIDQLMVEAEAQERAAAGDAASPTPPAKGAAPGERRGSAAGRAEAVHLQLVRGRVVSVREEDVFVELMGMGSKMQGVVPLKQFERAPRVGSIMDFLVQRVDEAEGVVHLSREGAISHAAWEQLTRGEIVEVKVTGTNKGGLELALVGGNVRGFMPASQVDLHHVDDLAPFVGQKFPAMVQDVDRKNRTVVASRRAYLEAERRKAEKKAWEVLEAGQLLDGTVTKLMEFGAFVDIGGGVEGLLHISDMSYSRVEKPDQVVKPGDKVHVKVLKLDPAKRRISLGLKQTQPDPWEQALGQLTQGKDAEGLVVRLADFGAFVELLPGVDGLLPVSEMSWTRVRHPKDVVKEGDRIRVKVVEISAEKRRLTLSLKGLSDDPWLGAEHKYAANSIVDAEVVSIADFGAFVRIVDGVEGLVHISELADRRVNAVTDILKVGQREKFRVLEIDEGNRKVRLSLSQVKNPKAEKPPRPAPEAREQVPSQYTARAKPKGDGSLKGGMGVTKAMGTGLGDLKL